MPSVVFCGTKIENRQYLKDAFIRDRNWVLGNSHHDPDTHAVMVGLSGVQHNLSMLHTFAIRKTIGFDINVFGITVYNGHKHTEMFTCRLESFCPSKNRVVAMRDTQRWEKIASRYGLPTPRG